jgi:CheY-like chemotaxis protein
VRSGASLELVRLAGDSREAIEEARVMMEEQVALLVRLVDDLLDVSRIASGKIRLQRRPTPLADLVDVAVATNRAALEAAKLSLNIDLPDRGVVIDADATRFVQILSNVMNNAIKFTEGGGRISISAEVAPARGGDAGEVAIVIADSGVGISPDILPRVFDLFAQDGATVHRSATGLGIGLALARRLIELHDGSIVAHSDGPGRGSRFTLRMPLATRTAEVQSAVPAPPVPRINGHVLVIDDNPSAARAIQRLVTALGGDCQIAHDGETGLAHIRERRPDVVILDIGMPRLDGYETCRRIRQEFGPDLMIVALTGWGQERDKQTAMQAGFNVHLTKPADPLMLEALLAGRN